MLEYNVHVNIVRDVKQQNEYFLLIERQQSAVFTITSKGYP